MGRESLRRLRSPPEMYFISAMRFFSASPNRRSCRACQVLIAASYLMSAAERSYPTSCGGICLKVILGPAAAVAPIFFSTRLSTVSFAASCECKPENCLCRPGSDHTCTPLSVRITSHGCPSSPSRIVFSWKLLARAEGGLNAASSTCKSAIAFRSAVACPYAPGGAAPPPPTPRPGTTAVEALPVGLRSAGGLPGGLGREAGGGADWRRAAGGFWPGGAAASCPPEPYVFPPIANVHPSPASLAPLPTDAVHTHFGRRRVWVASCSTSYSSACTINFPLRIVRSSTSHQPSCSLSSRKSPGVSSRANTAGGGGGSGRTSLVSMATSIGLSKSSLTES
mmetsp:Transcript_20297/g.51576  ORF Transcript_20297/g.51576 Transcript_20297/m.51576 type:complete len:338 (+) Transcript_20297:729-1742(+)